MSRNTLKKLVALYSRIPEAPACTRNCTKCCGPVFMARIEAEILGHDECITPFDPVTLKCGYIKDGKCSVYDKRPFTCRVFNAVKDGPLACFHTDNGKMAMDMCEHLYNEYMYEIVAENAESADMMMAAINKYGDVAYEHDLRNGWLHHDPRTGEPIKNYEGSMK